MNKQATSLKFGFLAGIIMSILLLLIYFVSKAILASGMLMIFVYLPLIFLMIWGGITVRRERGFDGFGDAFMSVFIISVIATVLFDTTDLALYKVIDPGLSSFVKEKVIDNTSKMMEKFGAPEEQIEKTTKQMEDKDIAPSYITYLFHIIMGALFSLLIALFVRRTGAEPVVKAEG